MLQSKLLCRLQSWRALRGILCQASSACREAFQWAHPLSRCQILWTSE
jgi:hypothetical protein